MFAAIFLELGSYIIRSNILTMKGLYLLLYNSTGSNTSNTGNMKNTNFAVIV